MVCVLTYICNHANLVLHYVVGFVEFIKWVQCTAMNVLSTLSLCCQFFSCIMWKWSGVEEHDTVWEAIRWQSL